MLSLVPGSSRQGITMIKLLGCLGSHLSQNARHAFSTPKTSERFATGTMHREDLAFQVPSNPEDGAKHDHIGGDAGLSRLADR